MPEVLHVERRGGAAILTLDRPHAGNSVNAELSVALDESLASLEADASLSALIVTGAGGKFFCTGGDIKEYRSIADRDALEAVFGRTRRVLDRIEALPVPTIAAVEGHALGGGAEIVLATDLVVAARDAKFGLPEVKRGLVAGGGGILRLPHRIPYAQALEALLTGDSFGAEEAHSWGLVNVVAEPGEALNEAVRLAERRVHN